MDIWDVLKLMVRRWYVALPMVLLTVSGAVWTLATVEPHHTSDGHVMLLPPSVTVASADGEQQVINPWTPETLRAAVVTRLGNYALRDQLAAEGYAASWEANTDSQFFSVIAIQTTSSSPGDAQATLMRLLHIVDIEIEQQQQPFTLPPGARITSLRLDNGENLEIARGNQARALVVVVGIGGILTLMATVSIDVLMRARARRRAEAGLAPVPVGPDPTGTRLADNGRDPAATRAPSAGPGTADADDEPPTNILVNYRSGPPSAATTPRPPATSQPAANQEGVDDSTIILPLARAQWDSKGSAAEDTSREARRR
jgi:hypothetical protein